MNKLKWSASSGKHNLDVIVYLKTLLEKWKMLWIMSRQYIILNIKYFLETQFEENAVTKHPHT